MSMLDVYYMKKILLNVKVVAIKRAKCKQSFLTSIQDQNSDKILKHYTNSQSATEANDGSVNWSMCNLL
jgi:hypothetical protein